MKKINKLKLGDFFMLNKAEPNKDGKNIWQYEGYCRQNKKYCGTKFSDMSQQVYRKRDAMVYTDFEF